MVTIYLLSLFVPLAVLWFGYPAGLKWLLDHWSSEEYSHAFFIPVIGAYMVFLYQSTQERIHGHARYWGVGLLAIATLILLSAYYGQMISLYGFSLLAMTCGLFLLLAGWEAAKRNWTALLLLAFVVPLPTVVFNGMSNSLQLLSSRFGAWIIEKFGVSVHLVGNVIDIGTMQLQVVEACSGLRYLLPLAALAYIVAVFRGSSPARGLLLLLAAAPITVVMNSVRIALTAVLSEYVGINTAEGFLHDFEGWIIFFPALGLLLMVDFVMVRIAGVKSEADDWKILPQGGFTNPSVAEGRSLAAASRPVLAAAVVVMIAVAFLPTLLPQKKIVAPSREQFAVFPLDFKEWKGQHQRMDVIYRNALSWSDYLLANYSKPGGGYVNVFIPYFPSLYESSYTHNPAVCLPGNGWVIEEQSVKDLSGQGTPGSGPIRINRLVATIEGKKHVVYYWFQHKGQIIASQNMVKPVLLWNSLTEGRTDGALVRLTVGMDSVPDVLTADMVLEDMAVQLLQVLPRFVPN